MSERFAYLDNDGLPLAIAHRGGAREAAEHGLRENSLGAFSLVRNLGYRYIELDVRATSDEKLFVYHGQGAERINKFQSLKQADARALGAPLLAEVLEFFPDTRFAVDPKHWPAVTPLARVIQASRAASRICIGSFSQQRTDRAAKAIAEATGQKVCTAMGPRRLSRLALHAALAPSTEWRAPSPVIQIPRFASRRRLIEAAHAGDVTVISWVVDEPTEMVHLLNDGVDGLMTDRPTILKDILQARGQWHNH